MTQEQETPPPKKWVFRVILAAIVITASIVVSLLFMGAGAPWSIAISTAIVIVVCWTCDEVDDWF